jgi:hypothetical protein
MSERISVEFIKFINMILWIFYYDYSFKREGILGLEENYIFTG